MKDLLKALYNARLTVCCLCNECRIPSSKQGGVTSLHVAAEAFNKEIVDTLLQRGADIEAKNEVTSSAVIN